MGKQYRSNKYGGIYSDTYNSPVGRLFWLHVAKPKQYKGPVEEGKQRPEPKFEGTICFEKTNPKSISLKEKLEIEAKEMISQFNVGKKTKLGECEIFQDGDADQELLVKYPWLKGCWYMTARSKFPCAVVTKEGEEYPVADLLGGMTGKMAFQCHVSNSGLSYTLEGLQFWEDDGKRFGGTGRNPAQLFDACEDDEPSKTDKESEETPPAEKAVGKGQKDKNAMINVL